MFKSLPFSSSAKWHTSQRSPPALLPRSSRRPAPAPGPRPTAAWRHPGPGSAAAAPAAGHLPGCWDGPRHPPGTSAGWKRKHHIHLADGSWLDNGKWWRMGRWWGKSPSQKNGWRADWNGTVEAILGGNYGLENQPMDWWLLIGEWCERGIPKKHHREARGHTANRWAEHHALHNLIGRSLGWSLRWSWYAP